MIQGMLTINTRQMIECQQSGQTIVLGGIYEITGRWTIRIAFLQYSRGGWLFGQQISAG